MLRRSNLCFFSSLFYCTSLTIDKPSENIHPRFFFSKTNVYVYIVLDKDNIFILYNTLIYRRRRYICFDNYSIWSTTVLLNLIHMCVTMSGSQVFSLFLRFCPLDLTLFICVLQCRGLTFDSGSEILSIGFYSCSDDVVFVLLYFILLNQKTITRCCIRRYVNLA